MKKNILPLALLFLTLSGCARRETPLPETAAAPEATPAAVSLGGWEYAPDTRAIFLAGDDISAEALRAALAALPALEKLEYPKCGFSPETQLALTADHPEVEFVWPVRWAGTAFESSAEVLEFSGAAPDAAELRRMLPLFPRVREVDLGESTLTAEELCSLRESFPETDFRYTVELLGKTFDSLAEEIDLSTIPLKDTVELEAALPHFQRLRKVDMCECGLDNETMDALNRRHEGIEFVWYVQVFCHEIRTDTTYYSMFNATRYVTPGVGVENFRYCHDMIALDLGHSGANTRDIQFLSEMPHLQYLIIAECHVDDITVVGTLQELTYLEMFLNPCPDLSPLLNCPALTDLNISYDGSLTPDCVDVLKQMTRLERLWFYGQRTGERLDELLSSLPDCHIEYAWGPESTDGGWRQHEHYFAMRDALHMYYMA